MLRKLLQIWGAIPIPHRLRWLLIFAGVQKFPVGVVGVIVNEEEKILLFKHTYRGQYPWGLPSGWLKPGEPPGSAILREIEEETGLIAGDARILSVHSATDARRIDLVFRCRIISGEFRQSAEVSDLSWFALEDMPRLLADQYDMINEIFKNL
jgi:ADP-ribose pyrophosphatase YjhB (NUDIX family)